MLGISVSADVDENAILSFGLSNLDRKFVGMFGGQNSGQFSGKPLDFFELMLPADRSYDMQAARTRGLEERCQPDFLQKRSHPGGCLLYISE